MRSGGPFPKVAKLAWKKRLLLKNKAGHLCPRPMYNKAFCNKVNAIPVAQNAHVIYCVALMLSFQDFALLRISSFRGSFSSKNKQANKEKQNCASSPSHCSCSFPDSLKWIKEPGTPQRFLPNYCLCWSCLHNNIAHPRTTLNHMGHQNAMSLHSVHCC